ncbi:MAG: Gfo/Idh/MocA family oxidoreductase [Granulosicoccus sp.]|nr:Gfo/Idh/MocA family oxidoreductase [Granulosicoccus sp.]
MSTLRVACAGAGYFSQFHYDAWARIAGVDIVGSLDRDISSAAATGHPPFDSLSAMLSQTHPHLLDIVTPPATHMAFIKGALDHGVKAIICQKPFCTSLDEARRASTLCEANETVLVVHENFRFQPWYRCIRKAIDEKLLGDVHQLTFRLRTGDGQGDNAYLDRQPYFQEMPRLLIHETGVHWIDTFRYLLGEPLAVYADLRRINPVIAGEDAGYVLFEFERGMRALFDGNRHLDHAADDHRLTLGECLVEGTEGTLSLLGNGCLQHRRFGETRATELLAARQWKGFAGDCVFALQQHVINALRDGTELENRAADYLRVLEIEEAVYRSAEQRCRILL